MDTLPEYLQQALRSGELRQELSSQARWAYSQAKEIRNLTRETRTLSKNARAERKKWPRTRFEPLLVEDDPDQAYFMVRAFEKADVYPPHPILKSGKEAIGYLTERRDLRNLPSVVILDVDLPGKSGLEILAWIRSEPGLSKLRVIMLSASSNPIHVNRAYELGANSYLIKPTSFSATVDLVRSLKSFWGDANEPPEP